MHITLSKYCYINRGRKKIRRAWRKKHSYFLNIFYCCRIQFYQISSFRLPLWNNYSFCWFWREFSIPPKHVGTTDVQLCHNAYPSCFLKTNLSLKKALQCYKIIAIQAYWIQNKAGLDWTVLAKLNSLGWAPLLYCSLYWLNWIAWAGLYYSVLPN